MASEVELDLASIRDEDLLRRMWQQTEDFGRKKEIRALMYKLREARLREFYTKGDMDSTSGIGLTKSPLKPSHGESLVDQSFQSFKTKEIRDSESPTHELKFTTRPSGVIAPDTSGWNVVTSSEVSPDGKAYKTESLATTEGVTKLQGGHSRFAGMNEQAAQESFEGDDRNYVKKAGESSKTHLEESTVVGDEKSGRMESKSSTVLSSSSHTTTSKFSSSADDFQPITSADKKQILQEFDQLDDSTSQTLTKKSHEEHQHQTNTERRSSTVKEERHHHHHHEEEQRRHHHQQQIQNEKYVTDDFANQNRRRSDQRSTTDRVEQTRETTPKVTKVYLEEEVNKLAALPGTLISRKIDYPDENTKMITETKELSDGTIVTTKRYERKSSKSKTWDSDSRTHHEDHSQNRYSRDREIQDKSTRRSQDIDNTNKYVDRRSSEFTNEANRRSSEIRRDDIHKQNVQQKQTHEQVTRNESFKKHETQSFHKEEVKHHESDIRDHRARDEVDRAVTDTRYDRATRHENLKDQVENIALDSSHRTVKKDLSQTMRNEKLTNQDFIETERGCVMIDRSSRRQEQIPTSDHPEYYPNQSREYTETETIKTTRKESDFTTHGFPSVGPTRPQEKHPRKPSEDFSTHGFPSVGPEKSEDRHPHKPKDFTTHGFPSVKSPNESVKQISKDNRTEKIDQSYSSHHETVESRTNKTHQTTTQDFTTNGFPSVRPQKYVQEPDHQPRQSPETHGYPSTRDRTSTEEHYTTKHTPVKPQGRPDYERRSVPKTDTCPRPVTKEKVIDERQDHVFNERRQSEFETYGFPLTQPKSKPKPDDFIGTHGYPSVTSHVEDDRRFTSVADDTSSVTTEQTEHTETTRTYGNDYVTSSRITVEVDAAHDAFARSLRCVSPVDQHRPASSKSMRTSSGSVRSSISPDKRSHRSPSRESGTYSESSKISTSTVTKTRGTDTDKRPMRKTTPTKHYPTDSGKIPKKISEQHKSNETVDLTESKLDRHNVTSHSFRKTSHQEKQTTSDHSVSRSPTHSSPELHVSVPLKQKTTTKPSEPIYDVPKSNKKVSPSPDRSSKTFDKPKAVVNDTTTVKKTTKTEDDTTIRTSKIKTTTKNTKETEVKKRISEDEGFDAESPRSDSPTCSVDDIEYYQNVNRNNEQVTDLDEADITVEVNLKNMGRNVNLVTTIGDKDYPYTVNHDFISKEKEEIEINQKGIKIEKQQDNEKENVNVERSKPVKQPHQQTVDRTDHVPQENGHYERPSQSNSVFYTRDNVQDKPKEREPFFLKKQHPEDDGPKKPEDIKKPKTKPVLTRSETYEERCRKILGMDRSSKPTEVDETSSIPTDTTKNLITTEITVEEQNKKTKMPISSPRAVSPTKSDKTEYDEETISNITIRTQKIVSEENDVTQMTKSRSPSLSPIRRSKAPTRETSPNKRNDQPTQLEDVNYLKKTTSSRSCQSSVVSTPSRSPYSSPSRKSTPKDTPNETPQTRSPALSPTRKPTSTPRSTEQSPIRQTQKPKSPKSLTEPNRTFRTDHERIERVSEKEKLSTSSVIKKETVVKERPSTKEKSPERQNHITTAKIQLSPSRKPSVSDVEKPQKSPELKTKTRITTTTSTVRDEKTCKIPTQQTPTRPITNKSVFEKPVRPTYQKEDQPTPSSYHPQTSAEKKPVSRFERSKTETDKTKIQRTTKPVSTGPGPKKPTVKKIPVIERKDSAPVQKTIRTDIDITNQKMARSISENVIKTSSTRTKPEIEVSTTKSPAKEKPRKNSSERRPSKCLSTKTINLTTTNTLINSEDMENVIIDIQQAKSSREPSPNKIVPTPVPFDEDTGMPRYPDKVQEPDEQPRKSKIKNIPIFEEESKNYVGCQITEIEDIEEGTNDRREVSRMRIEKDNTTTRGTRIETTTITRDSKVSDTDEQEEVNDECLLSVHDKVSKFISSAEEVKKPKTSAPFRRQEPVTDNQTETDVCYLSVTDKVSKFLNTAENVTKPITSSSKKIERPNLDELDDDLKKDECVLSVSQKVNKFATTVEKLAEPYQQKSAELVAKIDRQVSRSQPVNDKETLPEVNESPVTTISDEKYTPEKRSPVEKTPLPKPTALKSTEVVQKAKSVFERGNVFTSTPRQRDILSRPSVWEGRRMTSDVKLQDIGVHTKDQEDHPQQITEICHSKSPDMDKSNEFINESKPKSTKPFTILSNTVSSKKNIFENKISTSKNDVKPSKVTEIKTKLPDRRREFSPTSKTKQSDDQPVSKIYDRSPKSKQPEKETYTNVTEHITKPKRPETVEDIPTTTVTEESKYVEEYESHFETTSEDIEEEIGEHTVSRKPETKQFVSPKSPGKITPSSRFESPSKRAPKDVASPKTPKTRTPIDQSFTKQRSDTTKESRTDRINKSQSSISAKRSLFEKPDNTVKSTNETRPSYMEHTVSSLEHRRDSSEIVKTQSRRSSTSKETEIHETRLREGNSRSAEKFGVELRRTNSRENAVRRKSSCSEIPHIEDIYDLELLEQMLNTVVGYEQRRRIRTQIRLVKKMMETQNKKENQISKTVIVKKTEHTTGSRGSSKSPDRYRSPSRREMIPMSPDNDEFTTIESKEIITEQEEHIHRERSVSPVAKVKTVTTVKEIHRVGDKPATKKITTTTEVTDGKPIWATKNILRKASDNVRTTKPVSNVSRSSTVASKTRTTQRQQQIKTNEEDCITSSYGIGPTDEDGRPLFGIRALKKKSLPGETTKVTGKVITEKYYSENGAEPIGERTVTVYSTNPEDIDVLEKTVEHREGEIVEKSSTNGFATITKTKKVGKHQDIERREMPAITHTTEVTTTKTTPKIVRKGSVKEISEKFIRKESSSSVTEKTSTSSSSYPKAGLILRTKTHSNKSYEDDNDYQMDYDDPTEECDIEIKTTRKHSRTVLTESDSETESVKLRRTKINQSTRSFLNSTGSKVTGVEDVLDRMRNADNVIEDGDTVEDREARALLNKFLGASVLMSGVESMVPKDVKMSVTTTGVGPNLRKQEVKTTRITKTIKKEDSSSPVIRKTCDIEEIWDEELLNKLLEQSTSVEERRRIRARLRQLMAEREASVNIVATIAAELHKEEKFSKKSEITKKSVKQVIQKNNSIEKELKEKEKSLEYDVEEIEEEEEEEGEEEEEESESAKENDEEQVSVIESEEEEEEDDDGEEEEEDDSKHDSDSIYEDAEVIEEIIADVKDIKENKKEEQVKEIVEVEEDEVDENSDEEEEEEEDEDNNEENDKSDNNIDSNEDDNDDAEELEEEEEEIEEQERNKQITVTAKAQSVRTENQKSLVEVTDTDSDKKEDSKPPIAKAIAKNTNTTKEAYFEIQQTGESPSLLPLLQGLLHKNPSQANNSSNKTDDNKFIAENCSLESNQSSVSVNQTKIISKTSDNKNKGSDKMSNQVHHVEDSGTESGEDLKMIAAGLRDSIQMHSMRGDKADDDLIAEVTTALNRLETSLKEGKDLKLDSKKRNALLNLVDRLQTGLTSPDKIAAPTPAPDQVSGELDASSPDDDNRRGSTGRHRFAKRRNRANRHTVGVSREELADARRYMEEMVMMENLSQSTTPESNAVTPPEFPIKKQQSAGSVLTSSNNEPSPLFRPNQFVPGHLKDASSLGNTAKSFQAESQPVVQMREKKPKYKPLRQSISVEQPRLGNDEGERKLRRPLSESYSVDINQNHHSMLAAAAQPNGNYRSGNASNVMNYKTPEEKTVYEKNLYNQTHHSYNPSNNYHNPQPQPQPQTTNVWQPSYDSDRPDAYTTESAILDSNKSNRFINKKLMMKRANTIDIPKPMKYINDIESDSEAEDRGVNSTKSIGLRGTVQVNIRNKRNQVVPEFEPKTENDRKFLAFIQKQSPSTGLGWNNPLKSQNATVSNWSNKFGSIKNSFESGIIATSGKPPMPTSSARNFWKKAELNTTTTAPALTQRKVPFSSKANDRIVRPPWTDRSQSDDEMIQSQRFREQQNIQVPKPILVNKFSHAPMSAFKPIATSQPDIHSQFKPIRNEQRPSGTTQFNVSPTKSFLPFANKNATSPTTSLPWASKPIVEHRVQNVATKFESKSPTSVLVRHQSLKSYPEQSYYYPEMRDTRIEYKRPSLPDTSKYNRNMEYYQDYQNAPYPMNVPSYTSRPTEFPPLPYVCTDYTQPENISTYVADNLNDSITNPRAEPIVLSSNRPVISPRTPNSAQQPMKLYDFPSVSDSLPTSPNQTHNEITDDELDTEPLMEYKVESKVMRGPVSQTAVTVGSRTNHVGDEKDSKAAQNLLKFMKNIGGNKLPEKNTSKNSTTSSKPAPAVCISPDGSSYKAPKVESIFTQSNENANNRMPLYQSQNENPVSYGGYQSSNQNNNNAYSSMDLQMNVQKTNYPQNQTTYQYNPAYVASEREAPPHTMQPRNEQSSYQKLYSGNTINQNYQQNTSYQQLTSRPEQSPPLKEQPKLIMNKTTEQTSTVEKNLLRNQKLQEEKEANIQALIQKQQRELEQKKLIQQAAIRERQIEEKQKREMYEENRKMIAKQTKVISEKQQVNATQTQVYKSSQPPDTPDIVKSSLPKEDMPILKKYGPAQPHLYTPNAYQGTVIKSNQSKSSSKTVTTTTTSSSLMRKFSEPNVKTSAPKIVETPATPMALEKHEIPSHIVYNKVSKFSNMATATETSTSIAPGKFPIPNARPNPLSKSDSWHQIVQQHQQATKPSSPVRFNSPERNQLRRAKSGHTLNVPKMFEAGLDKSEIVEKQKTVAAYFSGQKSPNSLSRNSSQTNIPDSIESSKLTTTTTTTAAASSTQRTSSSSSTSTKSTTSSAAATASATITVKKSAINRVKTSEKASIQNQNPSTGIARSQTMPHIANINLLDEKSCTTETTETKKEEDGAVVKTTTKVTTRTVSAAAAATATAPKPISPFAKFRQLDKQNSVQSPSSPLTPSTPGDSNKGGTIFKFTDPALQARAATVKEQLLQWCQMKTKEYENVQINNFSTSWTDGLAFCALIHHFIPDAFDYSKLTPKERRHNFELAFRVADEKAGIAPLLDVEDMVVMKRPDWKCVFTYVQSIYRRFRNCE